MEAKLAEARRIFHNRLLANGILTVNASGIPSNADKDNVASVSIAKGSPHMIHSLAKVRSSEPISTVLILLKALSLILTTLDLVSGK